MIKYVDFYSRGLELYFDQVGHGAFHSIYFVKLKYFSFSYTSISRNSRVYLGTEFFFFKSLQIHNLVVIHLCSSVSARMLLRQNV